MKNAFLRGLVIFGLGFGLVALSACADRDEAVDMTEEPVVDEIDVIEEVPMMDSTMADSTMMDEPMEEADAEGGAE